ncbi:hypothetical protein [Sinanaerobacter sp. ZZT-01]|uniref:hypothetical protein n=1 Tax=Sinanaerobacter sp. ZZT-01 TaxID=3111540 RepID=UPI002D79C0C5|nr:hypothetical protein [Sinanaerobacter sp. ZZT-01]WRR93756.1 hypothetical protein U5921_01125 [Sinanaerobacter sp. ZZT-01]
MGIYWYEIKKLFSSTAIWGFIAICLLFNTFLVIDSSGDKYADFIASVSKDTGYILNQNFYEKLSRLKIKDEQTERLEQLIYETDTVTDIFDHYNANEIGESYISVTGATGSLAESLREKYAALQRVVDEKGEKDEGLSLYFAGSTYSHHQQLFNRLIGWLLVEGVCLSVLLVFLSLGYEKMQRTESIVYSSKKGRNILLTKASASISLGVAAYLLLLLFTLLIYFMLNNYGDIWNSNVSSIFNYRHDMITGVRPFVTWHSFNIMTYLAAVIGISLSVILCFSLMAVCIAVFIRNHYTGFLGFIVVNTAMVVLPIQAPQTLTAGLYFKYYSMLTPVWISLKHSIWFTDGDVDVLWPHFEMLGISVSLFALALFYVFAKTYFRKRDFT